MPIFLVRWPDLSASLVRATDREYLPYVLDQVSNPEHCLVSEYEGPLFIDFRLPFAWSIRGEEVPGPITPDRLVIHDLGPMLASEVLAGMEVALSKGDDGGELGDEILRRAFPALHSAIDAGYESADRGEDEPVLSEAVLRDALVSELMRLLSAARTHDEVGGNGDPLSGLARQMGLPASLLRGLAVAAGLQVEGEEPELEPEAPGAAATRGEPLLTVSNHHGASSGRSPAVDGDVPDMYAGYFMNEHGEQAIYAYDPESGEATLRMGDAGWDHAFAVRDGRIEDVLLTEAEATWLRACWLATAGRRPVMGSNGDGDHG